MDVVVGRYKLKMKSADGNENVRKSPLKPFPLRFKESKNEKAQRLIDSSSDDNSISSTSRSNSVTSITSTATSDSGSNFSGSIKSIEGRSGSSTKSMKEIINKSINVPSEMLLTPSNSQRQMAEKQENQPSNTTQSEPVAININPAAEPTTTVNEKETSLTGHEYRMAVLYNIVKEFVSTIVLLILYSRIGAYNFYHIGIVIFVVLVVFVFPFMNPYLYFHVAVALQQGNPPGYKPYDPKTWYERFWITQRWLRKTIVVISMIAAQVLGAITAAYMRKYFTETYGAESLADSAKGGLMAYKLDDTVLTISKQKTRWVFEELFAVMFFLVGATHILDNIMNMPAIHGDEKVIPEDEATKDDNAAKATKKAENGKKKEEEEKEKPKNIYNLHFQAWGPPVQAIFFVAVLVVGLSIMFPTAHFSLSTSIYLYFMQKFEEDADPLAKNIFCDNKNHEVGFRFLGGLLATLATMIYYQLVYHYLPGNHPKITRIIRIIPALASKYTPPDNLYPFSKKNRDSASINRLSQRYFKLSIQ